jgi:hypothetical protein
MNLQMTYDLRDAKGAAGEGEKEHRRKKKRAGMIRPQQKKKRACR